LNHSFNLYTLNSTQPNDQNTFPRKKNQKVNIKIKMKFNKLFYLFFILAIFAAVTLAFDDHLIKRQGNVEKDVEAKGLPAIIIGLARQFGASLVAKCRANSCRGRCPNALCKAPKLSCCNLACKIGIGARIPRVGGRC
jgi:hypothetical protein